jgi:hypothetical protein
MKVALIDILRPYFFIGVDLGPGVQQALSSLHVDEYDTAWDDDAVVISGIARMDSDNPSSPFFSPQAAGSSASSPSSTLYGRLEWEWHDVAVRFRLTAARQPAAALDLDDINPVTSIVLASLGSATGTASTDYPNTQFRLELMFELVSVIFPWLTGARLEGSLLVPDPENPDVRISLPRVLLILSQDSGTTTDFDVKLGSFGAETLEDTDPKIAELLRMSPPFALTPSERYGFGIQKAVLDLSESKTPPEILSHFGLGDDWQGIYLPEIRLFASTQKSAGVAFNLSAKELLIGLDPTPGIWGDFNLDVDFVGDKLDTRIRIFDVSGVEFTPELIVVDEGNKRDYYQITVPSTAGPETENYLLMVDINSGAAPFTILSVHGEDHPDPLSVMPDDAIFDPPNSPDDISVMQRLRLFSHDQRVAIRIASLRRPTQVRTIVLDVFPDYQTGTSNQPVPTEKTSKAELLEGTAGKKGTIEIESQTDTDVILRLNPIDGILTVDGTVVSVSPSGTASVSIAAGGTPRNVSVVWNLTEEVERFTIDFATGYPRPNGVLGTITTEGSLIALVNAWNDLDPAVREVRVDGYASQLSEDPNVDYNDSLSERRSDYMESVLVEAGLTPSSVEHWGNQSHPLSSGVDPRLAENQVTNNHSAKEERFRDPHYNSHKFEVAVASLLKTLPATDSFTGTLEREGDPAVPAEPGERLHEPPAPQGQQPGFLRHIGASIRFERDPIPVGYELRLGVDFKTAHEEGLEKFREDIPALGPGPESPEEANLPHGNPNPDDGVVDFRFTLIYDPSTRTFHETLVAKAGEGDRDGLWSWGEIPLTDDTAGLIFDGWRDVLGLYFTLAPLLAETASDTAAGGEIVPLAIGLAAPVAITALGIAHVLRFTHYGVELDVTHRGDDVSASLLFDVESAILLNFKIGDFVIVTNRPDKPVKIRYKAIGFRMDAQSDAPLSFAPVFDSSRGYTLDIADSGSLKVLPSLGDALGDIIQVLGARIARTNPLNIEVELGMGVDLGVITVDRFGFRLPVDPLGAPSITAIGAGVEIPNVLTGRGYFKINKDGFVGQLDVTLVSVKLRIAGGVAVQNVSDGDRSATSTIVTLAVEIPGGIPLGGTGMAVFGVLGLFAMHQARNENLSVRNPALEWLGGVNGDPTDLRGWGPVIDRWAFGVGLVAGTIEGGTVLNLKGMLVLELPGPRVLLFVKANILSPKPETKGTDSGTLMAVVDISPQRILIGIQFSYEITKKVLELNIPVEAGFFHDPPEHFYVDVGSIAQPITAKILEIFDATAYFMVHGDGIQNFPLGPLGGFSVAAGFRASFTWGNTDIGLYLRIAAGFDVGIGFKPLFFAGRVFIEGELRLFIVSIEANAALIFRTDGSNTLIEGEVCGRVDFFFFSVKGCVDFEIGTNPAIPQPPDPIRDLMLQSRSPAILEGTGVDRGIDNILCRGTDDGSIPQVEVRRGNDTLLQDMFVPIDTIPLIQFEVAPELSPGATIDGQLSSGLPTGFPGGWQKRGQNYLRYTIESIELRLISIGGSPVPPGTPPVTEGPRPYTWRHPAQKPESDGLPVELALLDWKPSNVDKALVQSESLDSLVDGRWENICKTVAEAARVLWTFRFQSLGPSPLGWELDGTAWPDATDSQRTRSVQTELRVKEIWQTDSFLDGLLPTMEAQVAGVGTLCPKPPRRPKDHMIDLIDRGRNAHMFAPVHSTLRGGLPTGVNFTGGTNFLRRSLNVNRRCTAKVLRAPYELLAASIGIGDDPMVKALMKSDVNRAAELRDVVRVEGGPFRDLHILIFARSKMVETGLIKLKAFASGHIETNIHVTFKRITADSELPDRWTSKDGPWWDDVKLARAYFPRLQKMGGWDQYLITVKPDNPIFQVEIGVSPLAEAINNFRMLPPSYFLAVVDGLSEKEVIREIDDAEEIEDDTDGVNETLGDQSHALLLPDAKYEVVVHYTGEVGSKRENPEEDEDPDEIISVASETGAESDPRTFFTDSEPPRSLEPWMLAQSPSPGELYHFYEETIVVVFATDDVMELFMAYDRQLQAVARAASFRGSDETPEAPDTHLLLNPIFERLDGAILSPWETTIRRRLGEKDCLRFEPSGKRHGRVNLPFAMDPLTDYVLDIEMLNPSDEVVHPSEIENEVGQRPLYRKNFSTSRYPTREAFAEAVRTARVGAMIVGDFAPLATLNGQIPDQAFDLALMSSDIPISERPEFPEITVLWSVDAVPQPLGILIDAPEPLWRSRNEPEPEYDETGEYILRWRLGEQVWLEVDELVRDDPGIRIKDGGDFLRRATGVKEQHALTIDEYRNKFIGPRLAPPPPSPPLPAASVDKFVMDISGTRTLVILKPGSRGETLSLGLSRNLHPLLDVDTTDTPLVLCEVDLSLAPWEEPS